MRCGEEEDLLLSLLGICRVPKGRLKVAQDDSPGYTLTKPNQSRQGRLKTLGSHSAVPDGTFHLFDFLPRTIVLGYFQTSLRD
jgi:hypothetical protein